MMELEESQESVPLAEIVSAQDTDPVAARIQASAEYRLLWAILQDAIYCYFRYADQSSAPAQQQFRKAAAWIESAEEEWVCSFISICRAFQIEPGYLRRGLRRRLQAIKEGRQAALENAA